MSAIGKLRELLVDDLFGSIGEQNGRRYALLKERGLDAKLKRVDIYDVPRDSLLLNLDFYEQPRTLFRGGKGERQRCDYVLVTRMENRFFLVFIEIKSSSLSDAEINRQFKGAECVLDYCDAVLKRFHGQAGFLRQFEKRFVIFYKPRLAKQRTRPLRHTKINDIPERALKYPAPHNPSLRMLLVD